MKKLFVSMALLCLVISVSSCSVDDLNENVNSTEIQSSGVSPTLTSPSLENGDRDKDKDGDPRP